MSSFKERTSAPTLTNKFYIKTTKGGYNRAVAIDKKTGSVLPNCCGRKGQDALVDKNRGLAVFILNGSPVSQAKSKTALYRLVDAQSAFYQMAISNEFANEEIGLIKPQNIKEYKPQTVVGELCIYKHKSMSLYYVTEHKSGSVKRVYETGEMELKRFRRDCFNYWLAYLNSHVLFESYIHQLLFEKYYGML